jgi:hypothetical protein
MRTPFVCRAVLSGPETVADTRHFRLVTLSRGLRAHTDRVADEHPPWGTPRLW